jgi:hypothetical protein
LLQELDDLRYRLVVTVYLVQESRGCLTQDILDWAIPVLEQYEGSYRSASLLSQLKIRALRPQNELNLEASQRVAEGVHKRLDVLEAPFLERLVPELDRFHPQVQRTLLDIRTQLQFFNRLSEDQKGMLALTWNSNLSEDNRRRAEQNLQMTYENVVERARLIVNRIGCLQANASNPATEPGGFAAG